MESFSEIIIAAICIILAFAGIVGCVVPALPGPPLNLLSLIILKAALPEKLGFWLLIIFIILTILLTLLDYYLPTFGAKRYGVSKYGVWGSFIGMIIGIFFFAPFGMILGIIIGAFLGELYAGKTKSAALKAGFITFILSISMMIAKLILSIIMTFYLLKAIG